MAGSLIKIDEEIVTSAVASVTLGASNWDSSYDVYQLVIANSSSANDNVDFRIRVTKASDSSVDTTSNYDAAAKEILTSVFGNISSTNQNYFKLDIRSGTGTQEVMNGICYLFNFNNASEYSFITMENSFTNAIGITGSTPGGGVHTVAQSCNGVNISYSSGNIAGGTFTLYGLKK